MKKAIAILATLLTFTSVVFAQTASISGAVISQFGSDLDYGTTGFNAALDDVNIKISQSVDSSSTGKTGSGESDFYGEVKISGIGLEASTEQDTAGSGVQDHETYATNATNWDWTPGNSVDMRMIWGDISANLFLGPVTVKLFANSGKTQVKKSGVDTWGEINKNAYEYNLFTGQYGQDNISKAEGLSWENDTLAYFMGVNNDYSTLSWITGADTFVDSYEGVQATYGIEGVADITGAISSNGGWAVVAGTAEDDVPEQEFLVKGTVDLKAVDNLTVIVDVARALNRQNLADGTLYRTDVDTEIGVKLGYNLMLGDITIAPILGADVALLDDYETDATIDSNSNLEAMMYALTTGGKINAMGTTLTAYYSQNGREDNPDSAYTISADVKSVENLTLQAAYEYTHLYLADEVTWTGARYVDTTGVHAKLGYKIAANETVNVTPSAQIALTKVDDGDFQQYAKAALEIDGLVENTTFRLSWDSNELSGDKNLGQFVFTTELAF